jgi:cellulose synthase/poly-beta-1,6-N-acetylglucosamine synthase-like glycosyltransferase
LLKQDYQRDYEIIFVDDESSDNSIEVLINYLKTHQEIKIPIKIIKINHKGPAAARNTGASYSKADILLFTDSDCIPNPNWISSMINGFNTEKIGGVGGTYQTANSKSNLATFVGLDIEYRHQQYSKQNYEIDFIGTYSAAYSKKVFLEVNQFSMDYTEANAEDVEISYEIINHGYKLIHNPNAIVQHFHPEQLKKYIKQQYSRAKWRVFLHKRNMNLVGDRYAGLSTILQGLIWGVPMFILFLYLILRIFLGQTSIFGCNFSSLTTLTLFSSFVFVILLNLNFLTWLRHDKKVKIKNFFLYAIFISIRSICWFFGAIHGTFRFIIFQKGLEKIDHKIISCVILDNKEPIE